MKPTKDSAAFRRARTVALALVAALAIVLLAACGSPKKSADPGTQGGSGAPDGAAEQPVKLMDEGHVIRIADGRLLVTAPASRDGQSFVDAYTLRIKEDTEIEDEAGGTLKADDLRAGMRVEVWAAGPIAESYPAQANAARVKVLADPEPQEGVVPRREAVRVALESLDGEGFAPAVGAVEWDGDLSIWLVRLVRPQEEPADVQVDGETGRAIAAGNDAFRVFAPQPGTEVGPSFTVEGKARVFEAVFHWTLEDGHIVLDQGVEMADGGAPAWGDFRFEASYDKATQQNLMLILYVHSAKDGSVEKELFVPLKAPDHLVDQEMR